jgi:plastocyanin
VTDAVAYAMPVGHAVESKVTKTIAIEQLDREFVPYVSVIQVGTQVEFPTGTRSSTTCTRFPPPRPSRSSSTRAGPGHDLFDKPGIITIGCNIHDWMIGYILVVATPYSAKVDESGNAKLRDLRPGTYEVHAWHPLQRGTG